MATPKPPNLYYYASGCVNKNFEGSSIEEGTSNNIFYPNNTSYMAPHHAFPNPYAIDHRNQYENKSEQGRCVIKSVFIPHLELQQTFTF